MSIMYVRLQLHKKRSEVKQPFAQRVGVSLLKTLKGFDPTLMSNLETFFTLDYSKYEILVCVEDQHDPAIDVWKKLMTVYPVVDARLFVVGRRVGINPKINNPLRGSQIQPVVDLRQLKPDSLANQMMTKLRITGSGFRPGACLSASWLVIISSGGTWWSS